MPYSVDLRQKVLDFVKAGNTKAHTAKTFGISEWCIYNWIKRTDLKPQKVIRRKRKLDWRKLEQHVKDYPDLLLRERAAYFGVRINAIYYALKQLGVSVKKKP